MIEVFAFSLLLHFFVQNAFTFIFTLCILITWIMEMHFHFNYHFVFLSTSSLCLNQIATSSPSQSFLWHEGLVDHQPRCKHLKLKQIGVENIVGVGIGIWICPKE